MSTERENVLGPAEVEQLVAEARKAQRAVYLATDERVADDLSRIIRGLADTVAAARERLAAAEAERDALAKRAHRLLAESEAEVRLLEDERDTALRERDECAATLDDLIATARQIVFHAESNGHYLSADCQGVSWGEKPTAVLALDVEALTQRPSNVDAAELLAERDARVAAAAWDEGYGLGIEVGHRGDDHWECNPYRSE